MALRAGGGSARLVREVGSAGAVAGFRADGPLHGARLATGLPATYPQRASDGSARASYSGATGGTTEVPHSEFASAADVAATSVVWHVSVTESANAQEQSTLSSALLFAVIYSSGLAPPSTPQIKAGKDSTGATATWAGSVEAPTSSQTFTWPVVATGLQEQTSYRVSFVWSDGVSNSLVETSDPFTTPAAGGAAITEIVGAGDAAIATTLHVETVGEDVVAADLASAQAVSPAAHSEAVAAQDSDTASLVAVGLTGESLTASDAHGVQSALAVVHTEAGSAVDAAATIAVQHVAVTESAVAQEQSSSSVQGGPTQVTHTESIAASDTALAVVVWAVAHVEAGSALDSPSTGSVSSVAVSEAAAAQDTSQVLRIVPVGHTEAAAAGDAAPATGTVHAALLELISALDANLPTSVAREALVEAALAGTLEQGGLVRTVLVTETTVAIDVADLIRQAQYTEDIQATTFGADIEATTFGADVQVTASGVDIQMSAEIIIPELVT